MFTGAVADEALTQCGSSQPDTGLFTGAVADVLPDKLAPARRHVELDLGEGGNLIDQCEQGWTYP